MMTPWRVGTGTGRAQLSLSSGKSDGGTQHHVWGEAEGAVPEGGVCGHQVVRKWHRGELGA